jgi:hypothetical protein
VRDVSLACSEIVEGSKRFIARLLLPDHNFLDDGITQLRIEPLAKGYPAKHQFLTQWSTVDVDI